MELTFTGRGAMLYPSEGNTAAYFEDGNNLFLFDCGEDVAAKLIKAGKLTKDSEVYLFITHTHSDHVGSIGTLQQYLYWVCGKKLNIVYDANRDYTVNIKGVLNSFGLLPETYNMILERDLDYKFDSFEQIRYVASSHGDVPIGSSSIIINTKHGNILYTGDIADSRVIKYFMAISEGNIDKMYIDTSYTRSPVHLSIEELDEVIPDELRSKVYCMHINSKNVIPLIEAYGFNLVSVANGFTDDKELLETNLDNMSADELKQLEEALYSKLRKVIIAREMKKENNRTLK